MTSRGKTLKLTAVSALVVLTLTGFSTGRATAITGARNVRGEPGQSAELTINFPALEQAMEALLNSGQQQALPVPNEAEA